MKNILSLKRASSLHNRNVTRQTKTTRPEGCDDCYLDLKPVMGPNGPEQFDHIENVPDKQCICIDTTGYASFVFGKGIRIEGYYADGKKLDPVDNAWGASNGYFKVSTTVPTELYYLAFYVEIQESSESFKTKQIVALKDWEGTLNSKMDIETADPDNFQGSYSIDFLYAGGASMEVTYNSKYDLDVSARFPRCKSIYR